MSKQNELAQLADAVTVDGSNVGIGTSSPSKDLEVVSGTTATTIKVKGTAADGYRHGYELQNSHTGGTTYSMFTTNSSDGHFGGGKFAIANADIDSITVANTRLVIDSSGAVTMPSQPAFLARPVGYQNNIPNLTTTTVLFGAEVFDQNSDFSSNTFTAPVTGKYQLNFGLRLQQLHSTSSYYHIHLRTSNRLYAVLFDPRVFDVNPDYWDAGLGALADMDVGDTAHITVFQAFGSAQVDIHPDSFFSGYLVA